jgi:hypothetical protein
MSERSHASLLGRRERAKTVAPPRTFTRTLTVQDAPKLPNRGLTNNKKRSSGTPVAPVLKGITTGDARTYLTIKSAV